METRATKASPAWKNPRERLQRHLRRGRSSRSLKGSLEGTVKNSGPGGDLQQDIPHIHPDTRSNPFKRASPLKKRRKPEHSERKSSETSILWDDSNANDPFSNEKFVFRSNAVKRSLSRSLLTESDHSTKESFAIDFSDIFSGETSSATEVDTCVSEVVPIDLRLGTKLRVISKKPFPWMRDATTSGVIPVRITGQQSHEGLQTFLQLVATNFQSELARNDYPPVSPVAILESACLYWQFPCIPWMSTYPRIDTLVSPTTFANKSTPNVPIHILEALDLQWTECFDQLFLSWKKGDRKSFYMCCSPFTVLFTKINVEDATVPGEESSSCFQTCGNLRHAAVLTPSTIGFRQYLKSEGIVFEVLRRNTFSNVKASNSTKNSFDGDTSSNLDWAGVTQSQPPLLSSGHASHRDSDKENESSYNESDESPCKADLSGDHEWLENIVMSPKKSAKLRRYKSLGSSSNLPGDISQSKPELDDVAAVIVKGPEVQSLYNLLQSSRVCRSIAGPHANLPPTLIAAQPFLYSQMQSLRKTSQVIRRKEIEYVLELDGGPVMPHCISLIIEFIRRSGVCSDNPAVVRVIDRPVCSGLNEIDSNLCDWSELRVDMNNFSWDKN